MAQQDIRRVVILTGAGISAESGIRTFRASDGLWEEHRIEDVATPEGFERDPELVHRFYNGRRRQLLGDQQQAAVQPNPAHESLTLFQSRILDLGPAFDFLLVTQNVDDLHERAGTKDVCHMHGELLKMRCKKSGRVHCWMEDCTPETPCPCCYESGTLRPHIVWFGEVPFHLDDITQRLRNCDLFVSIGTSGNVYPAAGFFQLARSQGARTIELNLEPSNNAALFDGGHYGLASVVVPAFFESLSLRSQSGTE
jgi:NAD-dependent deacetylase